MEQDEEIEVKNSIKISNLSNDIEINEHNNLRKFTEE